MTDDTKQQQQEEDIPEIYSQEEINLARESLKSLTPEDYLSLQDELARLQANTMLPEATAICFTEVYTKNGHKINITCRGMSGKSAIDELAGTLRYIKDKYDMRFAPQPTREAMTTAQVTPELPNEPQYIPDANVSYSVPTVNAPAGQPQFVDIEVRSITRERKRDGTGDFLKVRGGMYMKYGVAAYDNVLPKNFNIAALQYGVEVNVVPVEMAHARVNPQKPGVKVVQFF